MQSNIIVQLNEAAVFQDKTLILNDINLTISEGEFSYLIGKTGSGKSSLLKMMYGALPILRGSATVCGHDLAKLNRRTIPLLRRKLGIVFQDFNLLTDRNVQKNLEFVLKATGWTDKKLMKERLDAVLNDVGMPDAHERQPHQLSGGEQQRVAIARALAMEPEVMLFDEPTSALEHLSDQFGVKR